MIDGTQMMFGRIAEAYVGRTVVVIGAGGIGGALISLLSERVAKLVIGDRDIRLLESIRAESDPQRILIQQIDVSDAASVADFFQFVRREAGPPQFLFYTAGILNLQPLAETTPEIWNAAVGVNLNGAFYCVKAATEMMVPRREGSILLLSSIAGTKARSGSRVNPVYNTTKAGLSSFVNAAAMQLRPYGIRINCISPGPTATSMMEMQPRQVHEAVAQIALDGRQNSPEEVAELALFVAGHGRFTGEDLGMGGGTGLGG